MNDKLDLLQERRITQRSIKCYSCLYGQPFGSMQKCSSPEISRGDVWKYFRKDDERALQLMAARFKASQDGCAVFNPLQYALPTAAAMNGYCDLYKPKAPKDDNTNTTAAAVQR